MEAAKLQGQMALPAFDLSAAMDLWRGLDKAGAAGLVSETRELVHIRPTQMNGCGMCSVAHPRISKKQGQSEDRSTRSAAGAKEAPTTSMYPNAQRRRG